MNLRDCTLYELNKAFKLERILFDDGFPVLTEWLSVDIQISDIEKNHLLSYQKKLKRSADYWNEMEFRELFIGPLITLVNFDNVKYTYFAGRYFSETFDNEVIK